MLDKIFEVAGGVIGWIMRLYDLIIGNREDWHSERDQRK